MGRYLGEPADGVDADWYIRVIKPSDPALIQSLIAPPNTVAVPDDKDATTIRQRVLEFELVASRAREARLAADVAGLQAELVRLRGYPAESEALQDALANEQRLRQEAEIARELAERTLAAAPRDEPVANIPPVRPKLQGELVEVARIFLPRIRLLRNSMAVLAMEYGDRSPLFRVLRDLHEGEARLPSGWKSVQGVSAWWERHVSNGQDNTGRIYARFLTAERCWVVLVSHKAEQLRDLAWIKKLDPEASAGPRPPASTR
jgi:hypothetical protein